VPCHPPKIVSLHRFSFANTQQKKNKGIKSTRGIKIKEFLYILQSKAKIFIYLK